MGFFSWKTQDTNKSIANAYSKRPTFTVVMSDDKGNQWIEDNYEGYGVFDGKDYYQLIAEMNGKATGNLHKDRSIGINLKLGISSIRNKVTGEIYKGRNYDFFNWDTDILPNGKSANECVESGEWEFYNFKDNDNVKYPNLTESINHKWVNECPKNCKKQGYFY